MNGTRDAEHVKRGKSGIRGDGEDVNEHTDEAGGDHAPPEPGMPEVDVMQGGCTYRKRCEI